jgi:hypothetical protein
VWEAGALDASALIAAASDGMVTSPRLFTDVTSPIPSGFRSTRPFAPRPSTTLRLSKGN